jgi:hypothetical protein
MNRIYDISNLTINLANIKAIRIEHYTAGLEGAYVIIELLEGYSYVQHPETLATKLIAPEIRESFGKIEWAHSFAEDLSEAWNAYLEYSDSNTCHN